MPFTAAGNKKMQARLIAEHGLDEHGKSIFHQRAVAQRKSPGSGYFAQLNATPAGRKKLKEIARAGAAASKKRRALSEEPKERE